MPQLGQHAVVVVVVVDGFAIGVGVDVGVVVGMGKVVFVVVGGGDSGGCDDMVSVIVADMSLLFVDVRSTS